MLFENRAKAARVAKAVIRPEPEYSIFPYHLSAGVVIRTDFPFTILAFGSCSTFCLKVAEQPDTNAATKIRLATRIKVSSLLTSCDILLAFSSTRQTWWLQHHVDPSATRYEGKPKYKYLLPLDDEIVERIKSLAKPYPKRLKQRERHAWSPSRRGPGSTDRGALDMSHIWK